MKKIISLIILSLTITITNAQFSLDLKVNDKLIYDVSAGGADYTFTLKIKSLKPGFNFAWQMTNEDGNYGSIQVSPTAMATSKKMFNYFSRGTKKLTDATSVMISKAAYKEIIKNKKVTLWDGEKKFLFENPDETDFYFTINGEEKIVDAFYLSDANGNDIVILKDTANPLILKMNIGWTIKLNTIVPANKSKIDLSSFIDKKITEAKPLWDKLNKSSVTTIQDLTNVGVYSGPDIHQEYFSHIEGLWVKAHNDTVTDIIYYPLAMTHSDHTYYGGDISIPQLSSFKFNRTQKKTFIKTKYIETSSYDTDIYEASNGNTMELYYNVPIKTKEGIEFGVGSRSDAKIKQQLGFITFQKK